MQIAKPLVVYLPDTRGVVLSRYGLGNLKIGPTVYTYSRLPGHPTHPTLGSRMGNGDFWLRFGTCPGATPECERICYAAWPVAEAGPVARIWTNNAISGVPTIPDDAKLLRLHVGGDFDSVVYIKNWIARLAERPDVACWGYTRSWRVPGLLPALEELRALPNVQLFASMDKSHTDEPPAGWRRAWTDGDPRGGNPYAIHAHSEKAEMFRHFETQHTGSGVKTLICPEETKAVKNCEECGFCFAGPRNDVTFLVH